MLFKVPGLVWEKSGGVWSARQTGKISGVFLSASSRSMLFSV